MKEFKNTLLSEIIEISKLAGDEILRIYEDKRFNVVSKSDNSPLTQADIASHSIIKHALNDISPPYQFFLKRNQRFHSRRDLAGINTG